MTLSYPRTAVEPPHGSIAYTIGGLISQVIGIPHPQELIPVIPKYEVCGDGLWMRGILRFCRRLQEYGPRGLEEASTRVGFVEKLDGVYGTRIPYLERWSIGSLVDPREALWRRISKPRGILDEILLEFLSSLRIYGVSLREVGLTGSLAAEIENQEVSDIDIVAFGASTARRLLEVYKSLEGTRDKRSSFGGLIVSPPLETRWRRAIFMSREISWIGVPLEGELCDALKSYHLIRRPVRLVEVDVSIEPNQESALLYPPCVEATTGILIVSFEYNVGVRLYEGGRFKIRGLASEDESVIYLGVREHPGVISKT